MDKSQIKILEEFKKDGEKWYRCECPEHGIFEKRKFDFEKSKYGCQKCGRASVNEKRYKKPFSEFFKQAEQIHGGKYLYPTDIEYFYKNDKINIFCKKHREYFPQTISDHLNGSGCPKCGFEKTLEACRLTTEEVVKRCIETRGEEQYDYSQVVWKKDTDKIDVICKKHNKLFSVRYFDFLKGVNCPDCAKEIQKQKTKETWARKNISVVFDTEGFIEKAKKIRPEFDYSKTVYNGRDKSIIVIFEGKEYSIKARNLLKGREPFKLSLIKRGIKKSQNRWKNVDKELNEVHKGKYEYLKEEIEFIKSGKADRNFIMHIKCPKHGIYEQTFFDHRYGSGCQKCAIENRPAIHISVAEKELMEFLKSIYKGEVFHSNREILEGKELDLYFPKLNLAIEYDGLFWHNNIDNSYKFEECRKKGIRLIRITEPEWLRENNKIKYFLKSTFGVFENKIYARKCLIKEIDDEIYENFCNENHLQGYRPASVRLGLFQEEQLIQIVGFEKTTSKIEWELVRECSKLGYGIIGGKDKLLKYFERKYKPKNILTFCEKDKFSGKSYYRNGFVLTNETKPSYTFYYKKDYIPVPKYEADNLKNKLSNYDKDLSEWKNMSNNGYQRLFDYGNYVFVKDLIDEK